jgi:hypothetical protein
MYLRSLTIEHMKRVASLVLDFEHAGQPRMWTVLIGENGTAKTSILQAIAMAAAGGQQVNTLARPVVKHLRDRRSDEDMVVDATFAFTPSSVADATAHPGVSDLQGLGLQSTLRLHNGSTSVSGQSKYLWRNLLLFEDPPDSDVLDTARGAHTHLWFVAGYGISRNLPESTFTPDLATPSIDRMTALFSPKAALASSSFANHFMRKDVEEGRAPGETSRRYARRLNQAIQLGGSDLLPGISHLELRGQGGAKDAAALIDSDRFYQRMGSHEQPIAVAGVALSHGYQSTLAWIADLIGHVLLEAKEDVETTEMEGLVLIDEIDLYLHPAWQATFITALRKVFPKIQFVATTHSPVVLAEMSPHEIVRLVVDPSNGDVVRGGWDPETGHVVPLIDSAATQPDPRPMTASEIYRTWFGIDRLTPNPLGDKLRRYRVLRADPEPSASDTMEIRNLRQELQDGGIDDPDDGAAT